ncbi:MAG TPA: histidine kinase [Actinomycetota bacterium]|nr:histidine kinase [Actinomycetota bacterium]
MRLRLVLWAAGLALGVFSLLIARADPAFSFAGTSFGGAVALLGAGWALLTCALAHWGRRPGNAVGPLLVAASCAWFLAEWDNPGVGSPAVFTVGLVFYAACAPLVGWATLAYPSGRLSSWAERVAVSVALAGALIVVGLLPALFFDPATRGCVLCPDNLVLVSDESGLFDDLNRVGVHLGLAWSLLLVAVAGWRVARSSPARRRVVAPIVLAGGIYLALVASSFGASLDRGFLGSSTFDQRLWLAQAAALVALALTVAWGLLRTRRMRSSLARLVVELGEPAPAGGLRDGLARTLADPELEIVYPVGEGHYADAGGRTVDLARVEGRVATPLVRDGRPVAVLVHRAGLLDDPELVEEVTSAARLALENERLQAEVHAQLEDLRSSRARIIEAGDAERRRLERDLHDGAQQRLVGLSLALRLLRAQLGIDRDQRLARRLDEAGVELARAVAELRELAHGIHPVVLSDEGLAAAVEALAEATPAPLRIGALPQERFPAVVETAAYLVVAEATKAGAARVSAIRRDGALLVEVETGAEPQGLVDLEDRVGALDGRVAVERASGGGVRIRAEIPCE